MKNSEKLIEAISDRNMLQEKYLHDTLTLLSEEEISELDATIAFFLQDGYSMEYLAKSYLMFSNDVMEQTKFFLENNRYRYQTYREVADSVYHNPEYMHKYNTGLALSQQMWYTHRMIDRWVYSRQKNDVSVRKKENGGGCYVNQDYLEIGPGHGKHFAYACSHFGFDHYLAVDLSETSVSMTKRFVDFELKRLDKKASYEVILKDFFEFNESQKFDMIVMGEVLEHVERPGEFLRKCRQLLKENGRYYITVPINSPAIDHIYLYRSIDDINVLIKEANLNIEDFIQITYSENIPIEKAVKRRASIIAAYELKI